MVALIISILSFFLWFPNSWAAFTCRAENAHQGLSYLDGEGQVWDVLDIRFDQQRFFDSYLSCMRFVESLPKDSYLTSRLYPLRPRENHVARLSISDPMIERCVVTPGCRLNPIYGLFRPLGLIRSYLKSSPLEKMPECSIADPASGMEAGVSEETPIQENAQLEIGKTVAIPETDMSDWLLRELDSKKPKRIFISTMLLSAAITQRVDQWLRAHPGSEAWVYFSYNMQSLLPEFPNDLSGLSPALHLVPVFQTPNASDSFHIKGVALEGRSKSTWIFTVNLRRFREEKVADRLIELKGDQAFSSFTGILRAVLNEQCPSIAQLECSNELRFGAASPKAALIRSWVKSSCQGGPEIKTTGTGIFVRGGGERVQNRILLAIDSAKKTIEVASHILNDSKVTDALLEAADRGVRVRILIGTEPEFNLWLKRAGENLSWTRKAHQDGVISHAKFMVIDREQLIWATGNFTATSLSNPWEICLFTRGRDLIAKLEAYFDAYTK